MIRGAVFDIDGTLLDSMGIWADIGERYLHTLGICPEHGLDERLIKLSINQGAEYIRTHYHLAKTPDQIVMEISALVHGFYADEVQLKPGVLQLLDKLRAEKVPMAAATSSDKSYLKGAFERLGLDGYFEKIVTCRELNTSKNSPDIYIAASASFRCRREETYVFEDALHAAKTAHAAGFKVVGVYDASADSDTAAMQKVCDIYVHDLTQLSFVQLA